MKTQPFRKKRLKERDNQIIRLAKTGVTYGTIQKLIEGDHGKLSRSRISQVVTEHINSQKPNTQP